MCSISFERPDSSQFCRFAIQEPSCTFKVSSTKTKKWKTNLFSNLIGASKVFELQIHKIPYFKALEEWFGLLV